LNRNQVDCNDEKSESFTRKKNRFNMATNEKEWVGLTN